NRGTNAARLLRRASGHGADPLSHLAQDESRTAGAAPCGSVQVDRHSHRHRSRLLGARTFFGRLPRAVRGIAVRNVAATRTAAGSPSQSPVIAHSRKLAGRLNWIPGESRAGSKYLRI